MTSSYAGYPARYSSTRLEQLVDTTSVLLPSNGQTLTYDESTAKWTNTANFTVMLPTIVTTAGVYTYTAAEFLSGLIMRDCAGANRTDVGPSAADLVAAMPGAVVGSSFRLIVRNNSGGAFAVTMDAGLGGTDNGGGAKSVAQLRNQEFLVRLTNVTAGAEEYDFFAVGTAGLF